MYMFRGGCSNNIRLFFANIKPRIISISNTPSRCLDVSFSIEGLFKWEGWKKLVKSFVFLILETLVRFKIAK